MIPLQDTQTSRRLPIQTILLIVIMVYVFYLELTTPNLDDFLFAFALIPSQVSLVDPVTLIPFVTAIFLHGGFLHIISNLLFLWVFGDNIEERFGWLYIPIFMFGGIVGNVAQYLTTPEGMLPILGASGAIAAVLGAYFILYPHHQVRTIIPIFLIFPIVNIPAVVLLAYWFIIQLYSGYTAITSAASTAGGVAYFAHIGGFVLGVIAGVWAKATQTKQ